MMSESFDAQRIGRYSVFRVWYEYKNQEPGEKLFIALKHSAYGASMFCWCIKATSQVQRFAASPQLSTSYVEYAPGEVPFFFKHTIIDPSNFMTMLHSTLAAEAAKGRYRIEGKMPSDFHQKLTSAIRASKTLEPKKKLALLTSIGESYSST
jgi:hypothetical protein